MDDKISIVLDKDSIIVSGVLDYGSLSRAVATSRACLAKCPKSRPVAVVLKDLPQYDSLAVSFLLSCLRYAGRNNRRISFPRLPQQIKNLIAVYNLQEVFAPHLKTVAINKNKK